MPFLVIAGTTYQVYTEGASEDLPEVGGLLVEWAWDMTPQLTYAPPRRARNFTLQPISEAAEQALRDAVELDAVTVSGDALGADSPKVCIVKVTGSDYLDDGQLGHLRMPTVRIIQGEA